MATDADRQRRTYLSARGFNYFAVVKGLPCREGICDGKESGCSNKVGREMAGEGGAEKAGRD